MLRKGSIYRFGLIFFILITLNITATGLKVKELGLKAGISLSNFSNSFEFNNMDFNFQTNKTLGIFFSVEFEKNVYSQTELFISEKGTNVKRDLSDIKYSLLYIDSFHLVKFRFPLKTKSAVNLLIGPYYSLLLHGEAEISMERTKKVINLSSALNINDWGFIFGANFETKLFGKNLLFELRYNYGLFKIFTASVYEFEDLGIQRQKEYLPIKNRSINFLIGYKF